MGHYKIVPQIIKVKGVEIEVPCKWCRYAPPQIKAGKQWFPALGPNSFVQVILEDDRSGKQIRVKMNQNGIRIKYPDSYTKQNWWDEKPTLKIEGEQTRPMLPNYAWVVLTKQLGDANQAMEVLCLLEKTKQG